MGSGGDRAAAAAAATAHMWAVQSGCCVSSDVDDDDYDSMTREGAQPRLKSLVFAWLLCAICWPFSWTVDGGRG